ncbi:hypothetical protein LZ30DRAFT_367970 [Colletotrichum cereale]|nr:hypothetical protein LZ30DRAFT_367970 [Colletotrichum cereale]
MSAMTRCAGTTLYVRCELFRHSAFRSWRRPSSRYCDTGLRWFCKQTYGRRDDGNGHDAVYLVPPLLLVVSYPYRCNGRGLEGRRRSRAMGKRGERDERNISDDEVVVKALHPLLQRRTDRINSSLSKSRPMVERAFTSGLHSGAMLRVGRVLAETVKLRSQIDPTNTAVCRNRSTMSRLTWSLTRNLWFIGCSPARLPVLDRRHAGARVSI